MLFANSTPLFITHKGSIKRVMETIGLNGAAEARNAQAYHFVPVGNSWKVYELSVKNNKLQTEEVQSPSNEMQSPSAGRS